MNDVATQLVALLSILARLLAAGACGVLVGLHSELRSRSDGLRMHALTAMGAALFMITASELTSDNDDMVRVVQGVASGVGFIGAATVFTRSGSMGGVATAASIWIAAAIGCALATTGWALGAGPRLGPLRGIGQRRRLPPPETLLE